MKLLLLLLLLTCSCLPAANLYRIACGGPGGTDPAGIVWSPDTAFTGGALWSVNPATGLIPPYRNLRFASSFSYSLPVPPGAYTVTLKFIAPNSSAKTFNVSINGLPVVVGLDPLASAGLLVPFDMSFPVVTTGVIKIVFAASVGNAVVSGIQVDDTVVPLAFPFTIGEGLAGATSDGKLVLSVEPRLLQPRSFISILQPGPDTELFIFGQFHGVLMPQCPLTVAVFEDAKPVDTQGVTKMLRKHIEPDSWWVDPDTCDVRITFAEPQTNYYVAILGGR